MYGTCIVLQELKSITRRIFSDNIAFLLQTNNMLTLVVRLIVLFVVPIHASKAVCVSPCSQVCLYDLLHTICNKNLVTLR